jgi:hypothetical protein
VSQTLGALQAGGLLAAAYNPVFAGVFSAICAVLCSRPGKRGRMLLGVSVLVAGWLLGDGMRAVASARDLADSTGALLPDYSTALNWVSIAMWAVLGFGVAYAFPAWAGAFVGRRVTFGTGWLAAVVVSATCSGLVAMLVARLA